MQAFGRDVYFQRALFLSWHCDKADCAFCYMSLQKGKTDTKRGASSASSARRSIASIIAEAVIAQACGWKIEFLSGGYGSYSLEEIEQLLDVLNDLYGGKQWLNIGALDSQTLKRLAKRAEGYIGTLECVNPELRRRICPSKPMSEILDAFRECDSLGLKKGATVIIGLGESLADFDWLERFVVENGLSRITFYALNPHKGTPFSESPSIEYYESWIRRTRSAFPDLHIIAGAWHDKADYFERLVAAGADDITKFPCIRLFGSEQARAVEEGVARGGGRFRGTLTRLPEIDLSSAFKGLNLSTELRRSVASKAKQYLESMQEHSRLNQHYAHPSDCDVDES